MHVGGKNYVFDIRIGPFGVLKGFDPPIRKKINHNISEHNRPQPQAKPKSHREGKARALRGRPRAAAGGLVGGIDWPAVVPRMRGRQLSG